MGFLGSLFKKKPAAPKASSLATPVRWKVTRITRETPTTISFEVDGTMAFKAGQFVLLRPTIDLPWRAYSFSRAPGRPLRLTVKQMPQGTVSVHLCSRLQVGDVVEVKGPYGQFVMPEHFERGLFIAGGSGVTPFLSVLEAQDELGWPTPITLLDFNRTEAEQILKQELDALVAKSGGKLVVRHVLDDRDGGPPSAQTLASLMQGPAEVVAMCGPEPLMDLCRAQAKAQFPAATVLEEKFTVSHDTGGSGATHEVEFVLNGKARTFPVREGEHVLAAGRKSGVDLAAGCEMGACGVCRVRVLEGAIEVPEDACLSDGEKAEGYALVCVGKVKQRTRIEPAP